MKYYTIEDRYTDSTGRDKMYRFVSLYNGIKGTWASKETAEKQGQQHQKIIEMIHLQPMFILNSEDLK